MSELAVDQLLDDKYRIVRLLGQGAWATVYEAINVRIQRRLALKILNIELASQPELLARFSREAEAATQIDSPFVVSMFDAGTLPDGRPYIAMEYLEGEDLGKRLKRVGALREDHAANYTIHLLSGLTDAHANGILHRDIKPDNLVVVKTKTGEEILKLVDFGISKPSTARPEMLQMTNTDLVLGSPVYMSPEQARGTRHMDHRSDLYSVGVVMFEMLTLALPHEADNFNELMFKVALEDAPSPATKRPDLDPALAEIVHKALSRDPAARFQDATEFRNAVVLWAEKRGTLRSSSPYVASNIRVRTPELEARLTSERDALSATMLEPGTAPVLPPPAQSPLRLILAVALGVSILLGAVGVILMRSKSPEPAPLVSTVTATAPSATAPPTSAAPVVSASPPALETASAKASATPPPAHPPTVATPRPLGRPPTPSHPTARGTAAAPVTPSATTTSSNTTVVDGRSVRTTF